MRIASQNIWDLRHGRLDATDCLCFGAIVPSVHSTVLLHSYLVDRGESAWSKASVRFTTIGVYARLVTHTCEHLRKLWRGFAPSDQCIEKGTKMLQGIKSANAPARERSRQKAYLGNTCWVGLNGKADALESRVLFIVVLDLRQCIAPRLDEDT